MFRPALAAAGIAFLAAPSLAAEAASPAAVQLRGEWTQFLSGAVAGAGDEAVRYGGRVDGFLTADGEKLGLWKGLSFQAQGEFVYGKNSNRIGARLLLPVNTALNFPSNNGESTDFSFSVVQRIGKSRLQFGKINLLEASSATPIVGGGGKEGFQHIGLAAPPGLIASPKVFGAIGSVPVGPLILNLGVWTPESWIRTYVPDKLFERGVNAMFVAVLPAKLGGQQGWHSFSVYATSRQAQSGESAPDIQPPPGFEGLERPDQGGAYFKYSVQQYLWRDPANPKRGWGLFGHVGVSTGTPELLDWSMTAGVAGSPPIASRPNDRFGLGYFRFTVSDRLVDGLEVIAPLAPEQGAELYYTAEVVPHMRLTANVQWVDPVLRNAPEAAYLNLRAKYDF